MNQSGAPNPEFQSPPRPARVVVVGHTAMAGVDAALRSDRGIELVRARTPLAAIGEAADPIDESSPADLTVVVSPEAVAPDRAASFVRAIRRVDEHAKLLCLGEHVIDGFDGRTSPQTVRDDVRHAPAPRPEGPPRLSRPDTPVTPGAAPESPSPAPASARAAPAAALAMGHDPVAAALDALKLRWNLSEARVEGPEAAGGAAVEFNGRRVGTLVTQPALPREASAIEASELAPWIVLARQHQQLRQAAFTDELTGAWNRRYFNRFLGTAIAAAAEKRHTVTLLVFDIDNFKSYNDRFGHAAGDEILVEAVRLLNGSIRATDRVCRVGGDEFAVIFHDPTGPRGGTTGGPTSPQSIAEVVRRFQKAICEHRFPKLAELAPGTLTISGGMASFPWDGRTVDQLLDKADALAMQSKQLGKNKVTFGPGSEQVCGV